MMLPSSITQRLTTNRSASSREPIQYSLAMSATDRRALLLMQLQQLAAQANSREEAFNILLQYKALKES